MKKKIKKFIKDENITLKTIINPVFIFKLLYKLKYIQFFVIGVTGVLINLFFSFITAEFIFTAEKYEILYYLVVFNTTIGIFVGTSANLVYNFILHTKITFNTKKNHKKRFAYFVLYSLFMSYVVLLPLTLLFRNILQELFLPHSEVLARGAYLIAPPFVIFVFSIVSFLVFKFWIFKEKKHH